MTPRRMRRAGRRNPASTSESGAWLVVQELALRVKRDPKATVAIKSDMQSIVNISRAILKQLKRGEHVNPSLAIIGRANPGRTRANRRTRANPGGARAVAVLGAVREMRYKRAINPGRGHWYRHVYAAPMFLTAMSDGSLRIAHPRVRAWEQE